MLRRQNVFSSVGRIRRTTGQPNTNPSFQFENLKTHFATPFWSAFPKSILILHLYSSYIQLHVLLRLCLKIYFVENYDFFFYKFNFSSSFCSYTIFANSFITAIVYLCIIHRAHFFCHSIKKKYRFPTVVENTMYMFRFFFFFWNIMDCATQ